MKIPPIMKLKVKKECQTMGLGIKKIMCNGCLANKSSVMIENEEAKKKNKRKN